MNPPHHGHPADQVEQGVGGEDRAAHGHIVLGPGGAVADRYAGRLEAAAQRRRRTVQTRREDADRVAIHEEPACLLVQRDDRPVERQFVDDEQHPHVPQPTRRGAACEGGAGVLAAVTLRHDAGALVAAVPWAREAKAK